MIGLPKITKELNRAKKHVGEVLEEVIDTIKDGRRLAKETVVIIEAALRDVREDEG